MASPITETITDTAFYNAGESSLTPFPGSLADKQYAFLAGYFGFIPGEDLRTLADIRREYLIDVYGVVSGDTVSDLVVNSAGRICNSVAGLNAGFS